VRVFFSREPRPRECQGRKSARAHRLLTPCITLVKTYPTSSYEPSTFALMRAHVSSCELGGLTRLNAIFFSTCPRPRECQGRKSASAHRLLTPCLRPPKTHSTSAYEPSTNALIRALMSSYISTSSESQGFFFPREPCHEKTMSA